MAKSPQSSTPFWQRLFKRSGSTPADTTPASPAVAPAHVGVHGMPHVVTVDDLDDPSDAIRFGYRVIYIGIGVFVLWAIMAPLGEGIPAPGTITAESKRVTVTHLSGGTIAQVHLSENSMVREGETLIEFKSERAQTAYDTILVEYISAAARLSRLEAEIDGAREVSFPEDVEGYADQIDRTDLLRAQQQLFRARVDSLRSEVAVLTETLASSRAQAEGLRRQLVSKHEQMRSLRGELEASKPLVESGFTARNRYLEQERQLYELNSVISDMEARSVRESSSASEIRLRILQRRQDYLKEVETQTAETRREVANQSEKLKDAKLELERTIVHAPITGQIVSLMPLTPGLTVPPNAKLMDIFPSDEPLVIDAKVPVTAASRIRVGLETDIQISSFPDTPSLIITGRVISVSTDAHEPPPGGGPLATPYYLARIEVTPEGIAQLGGRHLRPGMSAQVVIKTGERSFLKYLIDPILRRTFGAFKEP